MDTASVSFVVDVRDIAIGKATTVKEMLYQITMIFEATDERWNVEILEKDLDKVLDKIKKPVKKAVGVEVPAFPLAQKGILKDALAFRPRMLELKQYLEKLFKSFTPPQLHSATELLEAFDLTTRLERLYPGSGAEAASLAARGKGTLKRPVSTAGAPPASGSGSAGPAPAPAAPAQTGSSSSSSAAPGAAATGAAAPGAGSGAAAAPVSIVNMRAVATAQAIASYTARPEKNELSFNEGDILSIVEETSKNWLLAKGIGGALGYVPASYVSILARQDAASGKIAVNKAAIDSLGPAKAGGAGGKAATADGADVCWVCGEALDGDVTIVVGHSIHKKRKTCLRDLPAKLKSSGDSSAAASSLSFLAALEDAEGAGDDDDEDENVDPCWACGEPLGEEPFVTIKGHDVHKNRKDCMRNCVKKLKEEKARADAYMQQSWSVDRMQQFKILLDSQAEMAPGAEASADAAGAGAAPAAAGARAAPAKATAAPARTLAADSTGTDSPPPTPPRLSFTYESESNESTPPTRTTVLPNVADGYAYALGAGDEADAEYNEDDAAQFLVATAEAPLEESFAHAVRLQGAVERWVYTGLHCFTPDTAPGEQEPLYEVDGRVVGGTLAALLGEVLAVASTATGPSEYISLFLISHRGFMTSATLLDALVAEVDPAAVGALVWRPAAPEYVHGAVEVLCSWMSELPLDFALDTRLNEALGRHYTKVLKPTLCAQLADVEKLKVVFTKLQAARIGYLAIGQPRTAVPSAPQRLDPLSISPIQLASQITLLESRYFATIGASECFGLRWSKGDGAGAPFIARMISLFNRVSRWIITEILKQARLPKRAAVLTHFVDVAEQFMVLKNFNGLLAVLSAFGAAEIHRLKKTWNRLPEDRASVLSSLRVLISREKNFKFLRESLAAATPPILPYLGMYLTDFTFASDGNADYLTADSNAVVSFAKQSMLARIYQQIQLYQGTAYEVREDPVIVRFIEHEMESLSPEESYALSLIRESRDKATHAS